MQVPSNVTSFGNSRKDRRRDYLRLVTTDIMTATKISEKPTIEVQPIASPQNIAENATANRLSVHMMMAALDGGTCARPIFYIICAIVVAPISRYRKLMMTSGASHDAFGSGSVSSAPTRKNTSATANCMKVTAIGWKCWV